MLGHRTRSSRPGLRALVGILLALGVAAGSASTAVAAPVSHAPRVRVTSQFVVFTQHNFGGNHHTIQGCGGHNIPLPLNSYRVFYHGQHIKMYNQTGERGPVEFTFTANAQSPLGAGWKSLFIVC
jgi:hypothetical protein